MNLEEIKEIIQKEGGKIIIVENDRPQLIVMSFEEYRGKIHATAQNSPPSPPQAAPPDADLPPSPQRTEARESGVNPHSPPRAEGDQAEGLTIDDLPL